VAEAAEADDGDLLAGARAPGRERRVCRDARAEQGSGLLVGDGLRNAQDEVLVHDDMGRVAALRDRAVDVDRVVRADVAVRAEVLVAVQALLALAARIDHAADADSVADRVLRDVGSDLDDLADDLVPHDLRERDRTPLLADGVDVAVADAGVADRDEHVVRADVAALDLEGCERFGGAGGAVCLDGEHGVSCRGERTGCACKSTRSKLS
jgi:hypothetical protein